MTIYKNKGIIYSNTILELLLNGDLEEHIAVDTFYNCREQGFRLWVRDNDDYSDIISIWVYANRNSDKPTITWTTQFVSSDMFDEDSWANRTESFNTCDEAVTRIEELIKEVK